MSAMLGHHGDADVGPGLLDLAVNVRPGTPPAWLRDELATVDLARYPDDRDAVSAVANRHGRAPDEVLITNGAAEAFVLVARALRPRRAVVVHPQFTEPERALLAAGHAVDRLVLDPPFVFDPADVPDDADLVVIGNPTNPTSVLHPREAIVALCRPDRLVVVDEAFADCVPDEAGSVVGEPGVLAVRSLTKTWGLAGLRVGYAVGEPELVRRLRAAQPHWPVSAPALAACVACTTPAALTEARVYAGELAARREHLVRLLAGVRGIEPVGNPAASFVLARTARPRLWEPLRRHGFAVRRGDTFPGLGQNWIRVAVRDETTSAALTAAMGECA